MFRGVAGPAAIGRRVGRGRRPFRRSADRRRRGARSAARGVQGDAPFAEQGQGRGVVFGHHFAPVPVHIGRRRGGSVDPVVLAAATGELADAAG